MLLLHATIFKMDYLSIVRLIFLLKTGETLLRVVAGRKRYLEEGRYTWRQNSALNFASSLKILRIPRFLLTFQAFLHPSLLRVIIFALICSFLGNLLFAALQPYSPSFAALLFVSSTHF